MKYRYRFRGMSITDVPVNEQGKRWCVSGREKFHGGSGGGIFEWCFDEQDATAVMNEMKRDRRFFDLKVSEE